MMKIFFAALLAISAQALNATNSKSNTIVGLAAATPDLSTLVTALTAGDLITTLSGTGPFTVFAPTNAAFAALPAATLASLLDPANKNDLVKVLTYHVLPAAIFTDDLKTFQMVKTVEGSDLKIVVAGRVIVGTGGAEVTTPNITASNGVVHIINGVLTPPSGPTPAPAPAGNHLYFRGFTCQQYSNKLCRCGEVDAAPRMPASLFEPQNTAELQRYIDITEKFYAPQLYSSLSKLELGRCKDTNVYTSGPFGIQGIPWTTGALMGPICAEQCHCNFNYNPFKPSGTLPRCKDQPDDPKAGLFCSLCGPKYNQAITINLYNGVQTATNGADKDGCRPQEAATCGKGS